MKMKNKKKNLPALKLQKNLKLKIPEYNPCYCECNAESFVMVAYIAQAIYFIS